MSACWCCCPHPPPRPLSRQLQKERAHGSCIRQHLTHGAVAHAHHTLQTCDWVLCHWRLHCAGCRLAMHLGRTCHEQGQAGPTRQPPKMTQGCAQRLEARRAAACPCLRVHRAARAHAGLVLEGVMVVTAAAAAFRTKAAAAAAPGLAATQPPWLCCCWRRAAVRHAGGDDGAADRVVLHGWLAGCHQCPSPPLWWPLHPGHTAGSRGSRTAGSRGSHTAGSCGSRGACAHAPHCDGAPLICEGDLRWGTRSGPDGCAGGLAAHCWAAFAGPASLHSRGALSCRLAPLRVHGPCRHLRHLRTGLKQAGPVKPGPALPGYWGCGTHGAAQRGLLCLPWCGCMHGGCGLSGLGTKEQEGEPSWAPWWRCGCGRAQERPWLPAGGTPGRAARGRGRAPEWAPRGRCRGNTGVGAP